MKSFRNNKRLEIQSKVGHVDKGMRGKKTSAGCANLLTMSVFGTNWQESDRNLGLWS